MHVNTLASKQNAIRVVWLIGAAGLLAASILGTPASLAIARTLRPDTIAHLQRLGLPLSVPAHFLLLTDTLMLLLFASVATLLFLRNPRDRMTRIASAMLLLSAALFNAPFYEGAPLVVVAAVAAAAEVSHVVFIYAFPNGRFVPRWFPWMLPLLIGWRFYAWNFVYLPAYFAMERGGEQYPWMPVRASDYMILVTLLMAGVVLQVYRYRRMADAAERQQVKWLLWGTSGAIVIGGGYMLVLNLAGGLLSHGNDVLLWLTSRAVRDLALALVPISLVYSITRYQLWAIDGLLSRTVTYGLVTATLLTFFAGLVVLSQLVVAPRIEMGQTLAIAASTLLTAAVARPLFRRVQASVDRRFDRTTWEAQQTVAELRLHVRDEMAMDQMASQVLDAVQRTWQAESVSLWIPAANGEASIRFRLDA